MKTKMGVWIDHRKAVIVNVVAGSDTVKVVKSNLEKHVKPCGGSRSKKFIGEIIAEDSIDKRFNLHLNRYYDEVILNLANAESLFIFGPGEAKHELKKRIKNKELSKRVIGVETTDKMTDRQIAVKVRKAYQPDLDY
ncbi:MAG: hypothetical protein ABIJ15_02625 [bacterium]